MKFFIQIFGRLPYTKRILFLTVVSGLAEGAGISMFLPLLHLMSGDQADASYVLSMANSIFDSFNASFNFNIALTAIVVLIISAFAFSYLQRRVISNARHSWGRNARQQLIESYFNAKWEYLSQQAQGEFISCVSREVDRASAALQMQILVIAAIFKAMILISISALLSWKIILVSIGSGILIFAVSYPMINRAKRIGHENTQSNIIFGSRFVDFLRGVRLIKVTGSETNIINICDQINQRLWYAYRSLDYNSALIDFVLRSLPVIFMGGVIYIMHVVIVYEVSIMLVFLLLLARAAPLVSEIFSRYEAYVGFVPGLIDFDKTLKEATRNFEVSLDGLSPLLSLKEGIIFDRISYHYPGVKKFALKELSFKIPFKKTVAIVGRSGAGKSTVTDLIAGLRTPVSGDIFVDGVSLRNINLAGWRKKIGYVTQDSLIFNETIRENFRLVCNTATDEDILKVLRLVNLEDFFSMQPDGLETVLGEGGIGMSGGEAQRFSFARALISNPILLILDEPTASLDFESEQSLVDLIEKLSGTLMIVLITHNLSSLRKTDSIIVLKDGALEEQGVFQKLIENEEAFTRQYEP